MTDEERKALKAEMKKQIDQLTDEELDQVVGGSWWGEKKGPYICKVCNKSFGNMKAIAEHYAQEHPEVLQDL